MKMFVKMVVKNIPEDYFQQGIESVAEKDGKVCKTW